MSQNSYIVINSKVTMSGCERLRRVVREVTHNTDKSVPVAGTRSHISFESGQNNLR